MRLKSIKLAGFKSFVDPTKVNLPSNLCAVVGPNGCGKSNIIDAVRWVMGESSAKNLRGESATDVIFNGSTSRQPVGQATIELIFDNHDRTLAGEFASYNEVSIRRKVIREGLSTYYLNGQKCRRRDVTDLFLGTGLGPRSYSIIEQGMISRLIESRPEELRVYIEEAAGISRYKERRRETSNRINRSRENLERLEDIREELGRQLDTLKRQAAAAEQYTELKQNERQHKSQLATLQWRGLKDKLLDQRIGMGRIQDEIVLQRSEQDTRLAQVDVQKDELGLLNESFSQQQGEFYRLGAEIARLEQTIEHQQQQQQQWQADVVEAQQQLDSLDAACATDTKELDHLQQQQDQLAPDTELASEQLFEAESALQLSEQECQEWQLQWQQKSDEQAQLQRLMEVAKTGLQHQQKQAQRVEQEMALSHAELHELQVPAEEEAELLAQQLEQLQLQQDSLNEQVVHLESQIQQQREAEKLQSKRQDKQTQELGTVTGQLASLRLLLQEAQTGAAQLPASWATDASQQLVDTMQVEAGWEAAVEQVLQDWLSSYLLSHWPAAEGDSAIDSDADRLGEMLAQAQGLTLLVADQNLPQADVNVSASLLLDKLNAPAELVALLGQIYVVDDWSSAQDLLPTLPIYASVVIPSGLWLGHGWVRTPAREGSQTGLLERKQQVQALADQESQLLADQVAADLQLQQIRATILEQEQSLNQAREEHQLGQAQCQQGQQSLALLTQRQAQAMDQQQRLQQRLLGQSELAQQLQASSALLQEELHEHQLGFELVQENIPELQAQKELLEATLAQHRQSFNHKQQQVIQLQARMDSVVAQGNSLTRSVERLQEQQLQWQQKQAEVLGRGQADAQQDGDEATVQLSEQLEVKLQQRLTAEAAMQQQREAITQVEQLVRELEQQQLRQEQEIHQRDSLLQDQRLIERELEVNAEHIKNTMLEQNVLVEKLAEILPDDVDPSQVSSLLEQCQSRIKRLGAINLVAIEEYKQQQERKLFLDQQHDELIEALDSLEQAISKIDKETRARFKQTFDAINESLGALFPKVFGGGRASLELTDDDMLATGVTIMAQPPGKRNSSIHLLSGGEKALTAIALVFSIFQLNPSPFCMLDEVDAPLDDANVERYARLVKEMSAQVQFIYISHNKIAMEMATQLLGVTMQEAGVSRIVTVDVEQAINMTEQALSF
jgi:chromosome segregation protein